MAYLLINCTCPPEKAGNSKGAKAFAFFRSSQCFAYIVSDDDIGIFWCNSFDLLFFFLPPTDADEKRPEEKEGNECL
jgi:hypothetical protein